MRVASIEDCQRVLNAYRINIRSLACIDIGGTERVCLKPRYREEAPVAENPLLQMCQSLVFLDKGFNIQYAQTRADAQADFLDKQVVTSHSSKYDFVFCFDTLEHVPDPFQFCENLVRAAKPSGFVYLSTLFRFCYHPSPEDYYRFTPMGLQECFYGSRNALHDHVRILWSGWESDQIGVATIVQREPFTAVEHEPVELVDTLAGRPAVKALSIAEHVCRKARRFWLKLNGVL